MPLLIAHQHPSSGVRDLLLTSPSFIAFDYESRYPEACAYLGELAKQGKMKYSYYVVGGGLDGCVPAMQDMFAGKNFGKTIVSFKDGARNTKL